MQTKSKPDAVLARGIYHADPFTHETRLTLSQVRRELTRYHASMGAK